MKSFQEYFNLKETVEQLGAICVENHFAWVKSFKLPDMNLDLPCTEKESKIVVLIKRQNPIFVQLSDGSKLFFSNAEYKRINGEPAIGKVMKLRMLRLPHDQSDSPSQIQSCQII
jgi:hypothetical protein